MHPTFSVDTHLFRELGELLVGRDSTALIELIKNSYDADATEVVVYGHNLDDPTRGIIRIADNGTGMGSAEFAQGFLRIASRTKDSGERRSRDLERRFTGAKGIGRLAVHKLARVVEITSLHWDGRARRNGVLQASSGIEATIRWDIIESKPTLDKLVGTNAITVKNIKLPRPAAAGTTITLRSLRQAWTKAAHTRFLEEIQTFDVPRSLIDPIPSNVASSDSLIKKIVVRDSTEVQKGSIFRVRLEGDLAPPDNYWQAKVDAASWILDIEADESTKKVHYGIVPTRSFREEYPQARSHRFTIAHPSPKTGPFFQSRILLRAKKAWGGNANGVRVFMEGFRVLPYGEPRNDWLALDRDVTARARGQLVSLQGENNSLGALLPAEEDEGLSALPNKHYFGGVFLTQEGARHLRMLVNREGFVPDATYDTLASLVRSGIDLTIRARAAATKSARKERRAQRSSTASTIADDTSSSLEVFRTSVESAKALNTEVRRLVAAGNLPKAQSKILEAVSHLEEATEISGGLIIDEVAMLRVLASVGIQLAAFVHEVNGLVGTANSVDRALKQLHAGIQGSSSSAKEQRASLAELTRIIGDLRRSLERQASYLLDVVTPDARRRRSRQSFSERFDAGLRLVDHIAHSRGIDIKNAIPSDLRSPPMFPAELTTIFSNLLTNAVKAAGERGKIRATAKRLSDGSINLKIENTGAVVRPSQGERWFEPFESSTTEVDAVLGQGMGLGLPITRSVLGEYGASIKFGTPNSGFSTSLEIIFPAK